MDQDLNLPKSPENRQLAKLLYDIKEGKTENQMMRFFRSTQSDTPAFLALRSNKSPEVGVAELHLGLGAASEGEGGCGRAYWTSRAHLECASPPCIPAAPPTSRQIT